MNKQKSFPKAEKPTLYFIGVTTGKSSIMKVFVEWAKYLDLGECTICGIDFKIHDNPEKYREAVQHIKEDPLSLGSLVTTHKIDLLKACRDQFDELDSYSQLMGEISCISKRNNLLIGHAKDPITSGLATEAFLPHKHWERTEAEALVIGAGGSSIAITWYLMKKEHLANRPSKIVVLNRSMPRLNEMKQIHQKLDSGVPVEYHQVSSQVESDKFVQKLKPYSLVINATGLGKDAVGSPLSQSVEFPQNGIIWDFNYRGDLQFLSQANLQKKMRNLQVEDGWIYFIHGWTRVIAEVFHIEIPVSGHTFDELSSIAAKVRSS